MVVRGGRARDARAFVMHEAKRFRTPKSLPVPIQTLACFLAPYTRLGWAFAILSPRRWAGDRSSAPG